MCSWVRGRYIPRPQLVGSCRRPRPRTCWPTSISLVDLSSSIGAASRRRLQACSTRISSCTCQDTSHRGGKNQHSTLLLEPKNRLNTSRASSTRLASVETMYVCTARSVGNRVQSCTRDDARNAVRCPVSLVTRSTKKWTFYIRFLHPLCKRERRCSVQK